MHTKKTKSSFITAVGFDEVEEHLHLVIGGVPYRFTGAKKDHFHALTAEGVSVGKAWGQIRGYFGTGTKLEKMPDELAALLAEEKKDEGSAA